ncbi:hypothetical protein Slin_4682 [Spirosoma linguale DSM 74]|uniref:Uncharacterized protein n=1 Tax=Spirosoma linguale (strain ATCC 33905 / DSM 74 / LMG 10896 / Claus 1) TaxID=504472 RepID=D2QPK1_SPILD|nr:hypothetical protein Slin_4682 [Spirosoma linguale DSM 74]
MIKRMRMFAGPNGSGKSTVKSVIDPNMLHNVGRPPL